MGAKSKTVLVVDDDPYLAEMVEFALESEGFLVLRAGDGQEALTRVAKAMPDLILLDMKMPVMDGSTFAREFRSRYGPPVPIVVFSADDARQRTREIGADGWISKPFDVATLVTEVSRHTG